MKGLVIFDERANLSFYSLDKEMEAYISNRMQELEKTAGASFNDEQPQRDMRDILGAFFLPLYTSFDVMYSLKKPILAIEGADEHLIVFRKFGSNVYIAISKEEGETEEAMGRKLSVFNSIIHFLHGPVESKINCSDLNERAATRNKLSSLLCTYETLYLTDQVFLVEALEHVQFGQLTAAANIVQRLTKEALEPQCNGGLEGVNHAMLLANTRFLAVSGKHPRMETSDILLVTLIVHHFYNHLEEVGNSSGSNTTRESEYYEGSTDTRADGDADGERYKTPRSTPGLGNTNESNTREERDVHTGEEEGADFGTHGHRFNVHERSKACRQVHSLHIPPSRGIQQRLKNALASLQPSHENRGPSHSSRPFSYVQGDCSKFMEQLIFLQPNPGDYVPHQIYALEVYPGIVLVLVAEHGNQAMQNLAFTICQTIKTLVEIDWVGRVGCAGVYEILDDCVKKVKDQLNKEIHNVTDERKSAMRKFLLHKIMNSWSNMKQADIKTFLNSRGSGRDLEGLLPARIEACAGDLKEKLLKLFEILYMTPKEKYFDTGHVVRRLMHHFTTLNQDYGEFLALKGTFNIPIVSFSMLLPGMVHFLFIDRSFNELTSPSLATDEQVAISYIQDKARTMTENPAVFLRRKIWSMVQRVQRYLSYGYTLQTWLDDDFLYTYYFWVNIPSSNTLGATRKFYTPSNVKCTEHSAPGVIGSSFFKDVHSAELLKGGGCYVYELYCLHEPKMSIQEASKHCRILADQLWPSSREAIAPFSLIN